VNTDAGISPGFIAPHLSETEIVPYYASPPLGERILVLAPHPDDETLGCGGSLTILSKAGKSIKAVFLTKGEKADPAITDKGRYAAMREKEASKAMSILGISDYEFLGFPDRELHANLKELREKIGLIVKRFKPDTLYSPSMIDLNPDHRTTAALAMDMAKTGEIKIVFYELTSPIRPNLLVNISSVFKTKKKAIKAYKSQLRIIDYLKLIRSLNIYRTMTLGDKVNYAEAFWVIEKIEKADSVSWLSYQNACKKYP